MQNSESVEGLDDVLALYQSKGSNKEAVMAEIRLVLGEKAEKLKALDARKKALEIDLENVSRETTEIYNEIRKVWGPFIAGVDDAELEFENGLKVVAKKTLNVKKEDVDLATEWFLGNGYEGVLKYQIHDQTMKKIARDEYEKGVSIPGLEYTTFTTIKVK